MNHDFTLDGISGFLITGCDLMRALTEAGDLRLARLSTKGRFDRLAKRRRALGMFFYPREWSMISGCGSRSALTRRPTPSFFPTPGFVDTGNYRNRILTPLAEKLGLPKLNFQVLRRTMATLAALGVGEGHPSSPAALQGRHHGQRVHAGTAGECRADG
jgi:hypothetical protein